MRFATVTREPQGAIHPISNPFWRCKVYRLAPLFRGMSTEPEAFLEPLSMSVLRPCSRITLKRLRAALVRLLGRTTNTTGSRDSSHTPAMFRVTSVKAAEHASLVFVSGGWDWHFGLKGPVPSGFYFSRDGTRRGQGIFGPAAHFSFGSYLAPTLNRTCAIFQLGGVLNKYETFECHPSRTDCPFTVSRIVKPIFLNFEFKNTNEVKCFDNKTLRNPFVNQMF